MPFIRITMNAAMYLVGCLFSKLTSKVDHHLDILKMSITTLLYALCHLKYLACEMKTNITMITDVFQKCQLVLQTWVQDVNVIGGYFFGGRELNGVLLNCVDEFKVVVTTCILWCVHMQQFSSSAVEEDTNNNNSA